MTGPGAVANWVLGCTAVLVAVSLAVGPIGGLGILYLGGAVLLGAVFVATARRFRRDPAPGRAMALFHYSVTYLTLLSVCVGVDAVVGW
ncbi:MAG TPA: hypothetical protein DHU96_19260 [Actinobacteria bacterium]|nr:hypothetical protein [Actinomycetota bacterium]